MAHQASPNMNVLRPNGDPGTHPRSYYARLVAASATAIERQWPWLLALSVSLFLFFTLLIDSKRPLWNDELFTYYISRQPTMSDVWKALLTGAEQLPPFFFVIIRAFTAILGASKVAFRLPETLGFVVMNMAAFFFVRKRSSAGYGLIAFWFPSLTYAYFFAYEARPYGLVMGFCGGAILCWQAAERRQRLLPLVGLTVCLASAVACHYYAVLIFFPFVLAECARFLATKRLDMPMYLGIALGAFPLILFLPLIRASTHYSSKFWAKPLWSMSISFYENVLDTAAFALVLLLLLTGLASWLNSGNGEGIEPKCDGARFHEVMLAVGFTLIPVVAVALAKIVTGAFTSRYAIYAALGIAMLLALSLSRVGLRSVALGLTAAAALAGCWTVIAVRQYKGFVSSADDEAKTFQFLETESRHQPVVIAGPHVFFIMSHEAALHRAGNFVFLADVGMARRYTETDTVERGLLALKQFAPLHVEAYRDYAASHPGLLVYDSGAPFSWVLNELIKSGRPVSIYAEGPQGRIYAVGAPPAR